MKAFFCSLSVLFVFLIHFSSAQVDLKRELVLHLSMEQGSLVDSSQYNHISFPFGTIPAQDRFGRDSSAYEFDGVDDYIRIPDHPSLDLEIEYTYSVWLNQYSTNFQFRTGRRIIDKHNSTFGDGYALICSQVPSSPFSPNYVHVISFKSVFTRSDTLLNNEWQHLLVTWNRGIVNIYHNGKLVTSGDVSAFGTKTNANNWPLYIGTAQSNGVPADPHYWHGLLDDVRLYRRALNIQEIDSLFKEQTPKEPVVPPTIPRDNFDVFLYPNPGSDLAIICLPQWSETALLEIFESSGKKVLELELEGTEHEIDLRYLNAGIYYFRFVRSDESVIIKKWTLAP